MVILLSNGPETATRVWAPPNLTFLGDMLRLALAGGILSVLRLRPVKRSLDSYICRILGDPSGLCPDANITSHCAMKQTLLEYRSTGFNTRACSMGCSVMYAHLILLKRSRPAGPVFMAVCLQSCASRSNLTIVSVRAAHALELSVGIATRRGAA